MRNTKNISQYDDVTGELLDGVIVYCPPKLNAYSNGWIMSSQEALKLLAQDTDLTKYTLRVFLRVCADLDFENWIYISQKDIVNELGISKGNVSIAIKQLVDKDILLKGPKIGRSFGYRLNPDYGWKGKVKNLNEYRKEVERKNETDAKVKNLKSFKNKQNKEDN